ISTIRLNHSVLSYGYIFKIKDKVGRFNRDKAIKLGIPVGPLFSKLQDGKTIKLNGKIIKPEEVIDKKFKRFGKKIAYLLDTYALSKAPKDIIDADILIHDSCFIDEEENKAKEFLHSTSSLAAGFAKICKAKQLCLSHFSSRYKENDVHLKQAKKIFKNTIAPNDLDVIEIEDY
ncbi:MAG: ribonuclease Z, partial [archaeon]